MVVDGFGIATERQGTRLLLSLTGELDMLSSAVLEEALRSACAEMAGEAGTKEIVLDLRRVSFMDSSGLRAILAGQNFCAEQGFRLFLLRTVSHPVERLLEIAGISDEQIAFREAPWEDAGHRNGGPPASRQRS